LRIDRLGRLHVRIDDKIFVYNTASTLVDEYALNKFGIEQLYGSYDFYTDNSMLLSPASIQVPAGTDGFNKGAPGNTVGKLLRCSPASDNCSAVEKSGQSFKQSFRTFIDQSDDIYLADTASGSVYWLNEEGVIRDELSRKLDRPSQIRRYDDVLVVAHTGGQELILVPLQDGRFAHEKEWQRIATTGPGNRARGETRPIDFTRIDKGWYVLAKTQDMRSGAIYLYEPAGTLRSHFTLPVGADPFALANFGGAIVVADYAGMAVHRYSFAGDHLGYLSSTSQDDYVAGLQQRRRQFTVLEYGSWGLFALALVAGFAIAIRAELNRAKAKAKAAGQPADSSHAPKATGRPHHLDPRIHWLQPKKMPLRLGFLAALLFLLIPVALGLDVFQGDDAASACAQLTMRVVAWSTVGLGMVVMVPVVLNLWRVARTRVGVLSEWVLVDHGDGNIRIARDEDLLRVANGFIIDYTTIPTGTPQLSLYDKKELEQWLMPRLACATVLNPLQQTVWQWHNKRGVFIALLLGVIILLPLAIAVQGDWAKNRFEQWLQTQPECEVNESGDDKNVSSWMPNN
jgi:hypothetical protein